jgi:cell division protein ZapA (FtsZ GTPase activity inhibitor)
MVHLKVFFMILIFLSSLSAAPAGPDHHFVCNINGKAHFEEANIEISGQTVVVTNSDYDQTVIEITRSGELYIDNHKIPVTKRQQKLLKKFNEETRDLLASAMKLGHEASEIGVEGADLGVSALAELVHVMFTEAEISDLEHKIEKEAEKLEKKAKKLEKKAEALEQRADDLEKLQLELKQEISELRELEWF